MPVSILPATMSSKHSSLSIISGQELSHFYALGNVIPAHQVTRLIKQEKSEGTTVTDLSNCSSVSSSQNSITNSSQNSSSQKSESDQDLNRTGAHSPEKKHRQRWTSQEDYRLADLVRKNGQDEVKQLEIRDK